ncbi:hypothetical protein CcrColossus_gp407 [Caulobacter phage CcrColossus]|uniref:Uncharacterized protein n=1 Tax=Caulobacter phage CcrColossus TaxID=1211640 RepID=K4K6R5_9CAUD|nr:hypothetical protein CcrColossus_gp407 [Caulobacter phage CcrColossus]AFU88277.1 hypothetical protein CcrColossus_gp407 [Caulobacter phage CcrColossus]
MKLTERHIQALSHLRSYTGDAQQKWSRRPSGYSAALFSGLVRRGLLRSAQQSEQVRGERRYYYMLYQMTPAGLEALKQAAPQ